MKINSFLLNLISKTRIVQNFILNFKKKKENSILDTSNFSDFFFIKYLKSFYKCSRKVKEIFISKDIFRFSSKINGKSEIIKLINNQFPNFMQNIIVEANNIIHNQFKVYEKKIRFKDEINWNYSFFDDKSWPKKHISHFEIYPREIIGDIRYNWEFNTHFFLHPLGLAYYFTGDEKFSKKLIILILDWMKKNPVDYNSGWKNSLITSYRLISWIFSLNLIKNSNLLQDNVFYKIFESMFQHAFYISINSSKHSYNHIIGEMFALFLFSNIFQDIKIIKKWYRKSLNLFKRQIKRQTLIDGIHFERTINYHRVVLELFSLFLIIKPNLLNKFEKSLINKMYTFLSYSIKPDNSVPLVGDSDDAHIIPLSFYNNNKNHYYYHEIVSLGCILFKRGDLKYICKEISPMSILLTGINGYNKFKEILPLKPKKNFYFFKNGGYFIARNNYSIDSNFLFFDMAEFQPPHGSHDHLDTSNIIYSYKGKVVLIDSGTYRYNDTIKIRNYFRRFKSHNVLVVEEADKIIGLKNFGWKKIPQVKFKFINEKNQYILKVQHNGFNKFITTRKIIASKSLDTIEISDHILSQKKLNNKIKIQLFFHFHEKTLIEFNDNEIILNNNLKMSFDTNTNLDLKISKESYYYSHFYGVKVLAPLIKVEFFYIFERKEDLKIKTNLLPLI